MYTQTTLIMAQDGQTHFVRAKTNNSNDIVIDDLFIQASKGLQGAANIQIKYHQKYGFPELIKVDWDANTFDDECFFEVVDFAAFDTNQS